VTFDSPDSEPLKPSIEQFEGTLEERVKQINEVAAKFRPQGRIVNIIES